MTKVASPCVNVCVMDDDLVPNIELCAGCYRTAEEITDWAAASDEKKQAILKACGERRSQDGSTVVFK